MTLDDFLASTSVGFRAAPDKVHYCVIQDRIVISHNRITLVGAKDFPGQLSVLRQQVRNLLSEYKATHVGIKLTESNAHQLNIPRINIEGVIQECVSSSNIQTIFDGTIPKIRGKLKLADPKQVKRWLDGEHVFLAMKEWPKYKKEEREAILVAFTSIKI